MITRSEFDVAKKKKEIVQRLRTQTFLESRFVRCLYSAHISSLQHSE